MNGNIFYNKVTKMKIFKSINELKNYRKSKKGSVGLVPTMGALHNGHLSLIRKSTPCEDFDIYPKREQADIKICELSGVDAVFCPNTKEMYGEVEPEILAPKEKAYILEGLKRPGHFDGVLRVVLKLFGIVNPTQAYFGKKDAQQLYLIKNMVNSLFLNVCIKECEIVREDDGLALSSRNVYLSPKERTQALKISKSLKIASKAMMKGEFDCIKIKKMMSETMEDLEIEYIEIVDKNFNKIDKIILKNSIILVAAKVGATRLIDNLWI